MAKSHEANLEPTFRSLRLPLLSGKQTLVLLQNIFNMLQNMCIRRETRKAYPVEYVAL